MIATGLRAALGVLLLLASCMGSAADVPFLTGRVVDNAEILSSATRAKLAADLKAHEDRTTNQVAVLTVPSLEGDSVEDFAVRVFEAWKLGQKGKDNGVLVVVAASDRRMRIEVGYGLEGTLTDAAAARIIRDRMTPRFKANDYDGGVAQGVAAIVGTLEGSAPTPGGASADSGGGATKQGFLSFLDSADVSEFEKDLPPWPMRILLGAFIFGIIGLFTLLGVVTPGMGWFLYLFLIPFWAMFPIIVVGVKGALLCLVIYVIGFPLAKLLLRGTDWYAKAAKEMKKTGSTTMGGMVITSRGSSSGGGGSSGGGFSGGGGSSGGGGASGSW